MEPLQPKTGVGVTGDPSKARQSWRYKAFRWRDKFSPQLLMYCANEKRHTGTLMAGISSPRSHTLGSRQFITTRRAIERISALKCPEMSFASRMAAVHEAYAFLKCNRMPVLRPPGWPHTPPASAAAASPPARSPRACAGSRPERGAPASRQHMRDMIHSCSAPASCQ